MRFVRQSRARISVQAGAEPPSRRHVDPAHSLFLSPTEDPAALPRPAVHTLKGGMVRKLIDLFMNEPAVALGVVAAVAIAVLKFANGGALTADDLIAILVPLGTAAGVRPLVSPTSKSAVPELVQDAA